jgi:hypothetical protein
VLKWLGRLGLILLLSLLVGLAIGTWLRLRLERPVYYIGAADTSGGAMRQLKETPRQIATDGRITEFGIFREPFRRVNLLDADIPGICKPLRKFRLKEWQHFAILSREALMAFVIIDAHYMANSFCYVVDRETGEYVEHHREAFSRAAKLAQELWNDSCRFKKRGYSVEVDNRLEQGLHRAKIDIAGSPKKPGIRADLSILEDLEKIQPLIPVLPISENRPMYTHKAAVPVRGEIRLGERKIVLDESTDVALVDVQKSFYPYNTSWRWATCAGHDRTGRMIALNLVQNMIPNDDTNNENCLWVDGQLSTWKGARFSLDASRILDPWHIETTGGECKLDFLPQGERAGKMNFGFLKSDYHQPYGVFRGSVMDSGGTQHRVEDFFGVTELHHARF